MEQLDIDKLRLLNDFVLVRRDEEEAFSPGGLIIPDAHRKGPGGKGRGTVLRVGPGKPEMRRIGGETDIGGGERVPRTEWTGRRVQPDVQAGDRVVFSRLAGFELDTLGEPNLVIVHESDLLGSIEED